MYNKLFSKIVDSSIWMEPDEVRILFMMFIAIMDEDGFVSLASEKNVAHRAIMDLEKVKRAIAVLEAPDPDSSNPANDGRRIERVTGGWVVLNSGEYRGIAKREHQKALNRERVRKHREKQRCNAPVTPPNESVTPSYTEAEAEAEVFADTNTPTKQKKKPPLNPPKGETLPFSSDAFKDAWLQWGSHRREIRKPLTPTSIRQQFKKLAAMSEADAIEMIENTIAMGWTGLRKPNENNGKSSKGQTGGAHGSAGSQCGGSAAKGIEVSRL